MEIISTTDKKEVEKSVMRLDTSSFYQEKDSKAREQSCLAQAGMRYE